MRSSSNFIAAAAFLAATVVQSSEAKTVDLHSLRGNRNTQEVEPEIVLGYDEEYDKIQNDAGISEEEYIQIVTRKWSVINFWTPEEIAKVKPRHMEFTPIERIQAMNGTDFVMEDGGKNEDTTVVDWKQYDGDENVRRQRNLQGSVGNRPWAAGGDVLQAAGRLLYRMGSSNYVCSATAVTDGDLSDGYSRIITAGHCVYDSDSKQFADSMMFIPHQDDEGNDRTDNNCANDKYGCWYPSHAIVDDLWANRNWPDNIPSDYAYLVVSNVGSHYGPSQVNDALESAVTALDISFTSPVVNDLSYALGYPASEDTANNPSDFRYCRQNLDQELQRGGYLLDDCGLTGGASGGPWIQTLNGNSRGEIIAVNSYGPGGFAAFFQSYMGGPRLHSNSAECLFEKARTVSFVPFVANDQALGGGIIVSYTSNDCAGSTFVSVGGDADAGATTTTSTTVVPTTPATTTTTTTEDPTTTTATTTTTTEEPTTTTSTTTSTTTTEEPTTTTTTTEEPTTTTSTTTSTTTTEEPTTTTEEPTTTTTTPATTTTAATTTTTTTTEEQNCNFIFRFFGLC